MRFLAVLVTFLLIGCGEITKHGSKDGNVRNAASSKTSSESMTGHSKLVSSAESEAVVRRDAHANDVQVARDFTRDDNASMPYLGDAESHHSKKAALTDRLSVFMSCDFNEAETAIVCAIHELNPTNYQYRFDYSLHDHAGNEMDTSIDEVSGGIQIQADFSNLSHLSVSTKNPYVDIENPIIDF